VRTIAFFIAASILPPTTIPAYGQPGFLKKKDADQKEKEKDAKNLKAYEKIKTYSMDKYASDPDFRDEVDAAYAELLRDHVAIAFERNTHRNSKVYAVNEDRFRMNDQGELYDNLLVQNRINRIGQSLVPKDSERVFAFRLTADPTPGAETLATGTIYVSTGMVSLLDNEAQLAYVLAHEMAHVQKDHWKQKVIMERGLEAYNNDQTKKAERITLLAGLGGGILGGATKGVAGAIAGGSLGLIGGAVAGAILNRRAVVNWDKAQEDEADEMAFKAMLDTKYDVREVPKLYSLVESVVARDTRASLGFLGERNRVKERKEKADILISNAYKAEIEAQLKGAGFNGDSAGHRNLMAELKRDNGIMAYYSDMFVLARKNLDDAVSIRDNDPTAQYYYGKVLETIGRTPEDRKVSEQSFVKAATYDQQQQENFGAHLHRALMMIEDNNVQNPSTLTTELDTYVTDYVKYQIEYSKSLLLPPNINTISEYMRRFGMADWHPTMPEGTENIRVSASQLPTNPEPATAPKTESAKTVANPCPPGYELVAGAVAGGRGAAAATSGCKAIQQKTLPIKK
jgi:hypothetical protein